jgi:hypothetical protein
VGRGGARSHRRNRFDIRWHRAPSAFFGAQGAMVR